MTLKSYLWGIRISTLVSLAAWSLVVYQVDPSKSGFIGAILFYFSLFLSLSGIFILFLTWIRKKTSGDEIIFAHLGMGFRQGILLAVLVIAMLILQSLRMLVWWDGLLVISGIFLIELYFLSR